MSILTEEQTMLCDIAKQWVLEKSPVSSLRKIRDNNCEIGFDNSLFEEMAQMGWTGITTPEEYDGVNFGFRSAGLLLEILSTNLVASPIFATLLGSEIISKFGNSVVSKNFLGLIASGKNKVAIAIDEDAYHRPNKCNTTATKTDSGWRINGKKAFVANACSADIFIISALTQQGIKLFVLPRESNSISINSRKMVDSLNYADIEIKDQLIDSNYVLNEGAFEKLLNCAYILASCELLGLSQAAFEMTLEYIKTRVQFDQKIGQFQAIQHRAAQIFIEIELARSAVFAALDAIEANNDNLQQLASLAKSISNEMANLVSKELIQLHGGIGMTDEYNAGFYLKRARVLENTWGNSAFHNEIYGSNL